MKPDIVDSTIFSSMDAELKFEMSLFDFDVHLMFEAISEEVVGLFLLVELVVGGHNVNLFS